MFSSVARSRWLVVLMGILVLTMLLPGCQQRADTDDLPVTAQDHDYVLLIAIDLSGSYAHLVQEQGRAYRFLQRAMARFFQNRAGANDRIVLAQLSGTVPALLWDGSPETLRAEFPSAERLNQFLVSKSHPGGSLLHRGLADTVEYALKHPGIASGQSKTALLVLSDMDDNDADGPAQKERLLKALGEYGQKGGVVGIYWCDVPLVAVWRQHLQAARLKSSIVESGITPDPALPLFE